MRQHYSRIAWSRSGLLAFVDGNHKVFVTWLQCIGGEKWDYVPPIHVQAAAESKPVHLSWSASNLDLAVADELGRVHIVSVSPSGAPKNQIVASAVRDQRQRPAELDRLVAVHWLDSEKSLIVPRPVTSDPVKPWESVPPLGPFHPLKYKSALVAVNGNGMLRLLVQTPDYQYTEIDALMPGAKYVSHAHFLQMGGDSLLIAIANGDNTLVVYEALIKWNPENLESKQDVVSVHVHPVATLPFPREEELKRLLVLRRVGSALPKNEVEIRAIYPHCVVRFQLSAGEEALHPSFFQLFNSSDPVPPNPYRVWKLQQVGLDEESREILDYFVSKTLVTKIYTDGTLERESLVPNVSMLEFEKFNLVFNKEDLSGEKLIKEEAEASSLSTSSSSITDICLSPTTCCAAVLYRDAPAKSLPKLISIKAQNLGEGQSGVDNALQMATALATCYACTVFNSEQCDDILNVCWEALHNENVAQHAPIIFDRLASETQRLLNVQLSAPEDTQKVERLVVIPSPSQLWLSFLISLGTGKNWTRTPGCYAAFSLLHLQLLAFGLTWTLKRISQRSRAQNGTQLRLEIQASQFHLASMLGPVRWATDLIVRISQELYDASTSKEKEASLTNEPNVYASLLLSGVARYLLRYFLRCIRSLSAAAKNLAEQETRLNSKISQASQVAKDQNLAQQLRAKLASPSNFTATRTLRKFVAQLQAVPIKLDAFEKLLVSLEEGVKALAVKTPLTAIESRQVDSTLIKAAIVPKSLAPLIPSLIENARTLLFPHANIPNLYFYDTSWLGLDDLECNELIDGIRKRIILPSENVQVCTRCGMKSVVATDTGKQATQWLVLFQRHCVCGGSWLRKSEPS